MKPCYKLVELPAAEPPIIQKVEPTDLEAVSWREAKKQLRKWYMDRAHALRSITEKEYFNA